MDLLGQPLVYSEPMPGMQGVLVGFGFALVIGFLVYCLLKCISNDPLE